MQPEPQRVTQDIPESTASPDPFTTQHGLLRADDVSRRRSDGGSDTGFSCSLDDAEAFNPPYPHLVDLKEDPRGYLSPAQRISEYESELIASTPRRAGEFGFKVIPSRGHGGGTNLEIFPNEVLTHILSHLPPADLSAMSIVSRRFHALVTTPHAWRIAFSRYFPGPASLEAQDGGNLDSEEFERILLQRRHFSRLTALASWRNEYIMRTRLLRSLSRGRPAEVSLPDKSAAASAPLLNPSAVTTYGSLLLYPVTHIDAKFGPATEKKGPCLIHGASEQGNASTSEPVVGKVGAGSWGITDPQIFAHFADEFPFESQWGLGVGDVVGRPNVMDVSQQFGMVYGEGCPPMARTYFLPATEKRGQFFATGIASPQPQLGIPKFSHLSSSVCSVWIAKSSRVLEMTSGIFGILSGSSLGILTAYSIGSHPSDKRGRRQVTARWVLCPGVPIISIKVDDNYSSERQSQGRIWAVVLNALGEIFYITGVPSQPDGSPTSIEEVDEIAWETGRSVRWEQVEPTRRVAQPDPHNRIPFDGSYSPRSSPTSMGLTSPQITAETKEIEEFLGYTPIHFRKVCQGWDMRRKMEVDFAGDDMHGAGESIAVINCGTEKETVASVRRYTRLKHITALPRGPTEAFPKIQPLATRSSLFGGYPSTPDPSEPPSRTSSAANDVQPARFDVEWSTSELVFNAPKIAKITATAMDISTFAQLTMSEDPLLAMGGTSGASSSSSQAPSPLWQGTKPGSPSDIPGQRARFLAVGTSNGAIYVWNIRAAVSQNAEISNTIRPLGVINTDSPQISSLAMTSLHLVHGGNDGLVQAWDPLASSSQPIRTLNSRFSSRARRHLAQAQASIRGVGNNYFAASAISLDPDPTHLRGVVALGTHLRYWSFSSSAADAYKSQKRRLRYNQRGNNTTSPESRKYVSSGRGEIDDFILNERLWLEKDQREREKQDARLRGRFGTDLLGPGASEEELLAYACMLSEETYTSDESKVRGSESGSSSGTITPNGVESHASPTKVSSVSVLEPVDEEMDPELLEAIKRSMEETNLNDDNGFYAPLASSTLHPDLEYEDHHDEASSSKNNLEGFTYAEAESTSLVEKQDLELEMVLRLSMADQQGLGIDAEPEVEAEEFPALGAAGASLNSPSKRMGRNGKGKGKEILWN